MIHTSAGCFWDEARWILDSRLVLIRKKHGPVPRPTRVGEIWRRFIGKKMSYEFRDRIREICTEHRQFGVGLPGGADALIHFRTALEAELRQYDGSDILAIVDIDFQNAFPSLEWNEIRNA